MLLPLIVALGLSMHSDIMMALLTIESLWLFVKSIGVWNLEV